jgi:hypothetical protein
MADAVTDTIEFLQQQIRLLEQRAYYAVQRADNAEQRLCDAERVIQDLEQMIDRLMVGVENLRTHAFKFADFERAEVVFEMLKDSLPGWWRARWLALVELILRFLSETRR